MRIELTKEEIELVAPEGFKQFNDIAVIAFRKALGLPISTQRIYLEGKTVCIKTQPYSNVYPELKEKVGANSSDIYVLVTVNAKENYAYLEGWTTRSEFITEKNLNPSHETYYMSYYDLKKIKELNGN